MRLYVWRLSWDGMWCVSNAPKNAPYGPNAGVVQKFWTWKEAYAWARAHPQVRLVPLGNGTYRVVGAMRRSAVTGRYLTSVDKGE